jgi:hypothetical protein
MDLRHAGKGVSAGSADMSMARKRTAARMTRRSIGILCLIEVLIYAIKKSRMDVAKSLAVDIDDWLDHKRELPDYVRKAIDKRYKEYLKAEESKK